MLAAAASPTPRADPYFLDAAIASLMRHKADAVRELPTRCCPLMGIYPPLTASLRGDFSDFTSNLESARRLWRRVPGVPQCADEMRAARVTVLEGDQYLVVDLRQHAAIVGVVHESLRAME